MRNLTQEESKKYIEIVISKNMDKMFDYGYEIGQKDIQQSNGGAGSCSNEKSLVSGN